MAVAIHLESSCLRTGEVSDLSEAARLAYVTQPRMTQIMNLLHLAPDIQSELLFLPAGTSREPIHEKMLRPVTAKIDWRKQREEWAKIKSQLIAEWS